MIYQFDIVEVPAVVLAITEGTVKQSEIPSRVRAMFDMVYAWLPTSGVEQDGHNYIVYDQCTRQGMRMRAGFPVSRRFADSELVKCVELQPGKAAHTTHIGPYNGLGAANPAERLDRGPIARTGRRVVGAVWRLERR
jgi:hypothetical protein